MKDFSKVKLLVIDMDNTLCDTFHTLSRTQWDKAADALERIGYPEQAKVLRRNLGKKGFKATMQGFRLRHAERQKVMDAYDSVSVTRLRMYDDAGSIRSLPHDKVLVTRGERRLQTRKIKHLGLAKGFKRIYFVPTMESKEAAFRRIIREFKVKPSECLVIGDRIEEEILEGQRLGMRTALVDRPDWPTQRITKPDVTAKSLVKIAALLRHV